MAKRYFEDITDGKHLHWQKLAFTQSEIIEFARKFDPQPFHTDEIAAKKSIFGSLIASSLHTISACTRNVVEAQGDVAILSGTGMYEAKRLIRELLLLMSKLGINLAEELKFYETKYFFCLSW